ncbi:MAG: ester cyclase [Alphaproteobacteria bacterium]|nr:ester cyclase [Alphaproteobacteria bacterium]
MSIEDNKAVARRFFEEFSNDNLAAVADLMAPDHAFHFPLFPEPQNKAQHVAGQQRIKTIFPDYRFEVVDQIAEGDMVTTRCITRGTQAGEFMGNPGTGQIFEIMLVNIMRIRDGLIVDEWDAFDTLSFLTQLGIAERP